MRRPLYCLAILIGLLGPSVGQANDLYLSFYPPIGYSFGPAPCPGGPPWPKCPDGRFDDGGAVLEGMFVYTTGGGPSETDQLAVLSRVRLQTSDGQRMPGANYTSIGGRGARWQAYQLTFTDGPAGSEPTLVPGRHILLMEVSIDANGYNFAGPVSEFYCPPDDTPQCERQVQRQAYLFGRFVPSDAPPR